MGQKDASKERAQKHIANILVTPRKMMCLDDDGAVEFQQEPQQKSFLEYVGMNKAQAEV